LQFQCIKIANARSIDKLKDLEGYLAKKFVLTQPRISQMISPILNKKRATRDSLIMRLRLLGWKQEIISGLCGINQERVSQIIKNINSYKINKKFGEGKTIEELATFYHFDQTLTWAIVLEGKPDQERFEILGLQPKVYDVWNYSVCSLKLLKRI